MTPKSKPRKSKPIMDKIPGAKPEPKIKIMDEVSDGPKDFPEPIPTKIVTLRPTQAGKSTTEIYERLLKLDTKKLSPWEAGFVDSAINGPREMDPKNLSIATSILRRYGG